MTPLATAEAREGGKQDRRVRFKAARALIFINFSSVCLALRTRKPRFEACVDSNGVFLSEVREKAAVYFSRV